MAIRTWVSQNGDFSAAASWSPAGAPASSDTLVFGSQSQHPVVSGLDQSAIALTLLRIDPEYVADIGFPGNPLITSSTTVVHRGAGTVWYRHDGGAGNIIIDADRMTQEFPAMLLDFTSGTAITGIFLKRGYLFADDTTGHPQPMSFMTIDPIEGFQAVAEIKGALFNDCRVTLSGGYLFGTSASNHNELIVSGGIYELPTGTTVSYLHQSGGLVRFDGTIVSAGVVTGGTLDCSTLPSAKTISTLYLGPGAEFQQGNATVTTLVDARQKIP